MGKIHHQIGMSEVLVERFNQEHPAIQVESLYVGQAATVT